MSRRPRVFATQPLLGPDWDGLEEEFELEVGSKRGEITPNQLQRAVASAEGLICLLTDRIDEALLAAAPRLRVVSSCSVGVDHIDLAAARRRGLPVGHTPGVLTETTADLCFGLLLAAARRISEAERFLRAGRWRRWELDLLLGRDLHGATLGVIGLGAIGRAVARRAQGFGMRVLGWSRHARELPGVQACSLDELLGASDFVSVHVALAEETRGLIGARELARMRPEALLVNTARGGVVDEAALIAALRAGGLAGAALDVFEEEPLPADSPLLGLENVVLVPHIGSASLATRRRMSTLCVENLRAGLAGRRLSHCANPEVYDSPGPGSVD